MSNLATIRDILTAHSDELIDTLAHHIAYLGARPEWTPEDNYAVTEGLLLLQRPGVSLTLTETTSTSKLHEKLATTTTTSASTGSRDTPDRTRGMRTAPLTDQNLRLRT